MSWMRKLSTRDRRALTLLAGAGGVILAIFGLVLPFYDAQAQIQKEVESKEKLLGRYVRVIQARDIYRTQLAKLERTLQEHDQMLLDAEETSVATIQLEEMVRNVAAQNNIEVTRSNPLRERNMGEEYAKITLQINLRSDITQLTNFLYALSTHDKFLLVENFSLSSFRSKTQVRTQPRMNISGFIRLSQESGI